MTSTKKENKCCFVCGAEENVVCSLPTNKDTLNTWLNILKIKGPISEKDRKRKICVKHFDSKWKNILLNENSRRGPYIFPISPDNSQSTNKRSLSPPSQSPLPSEQTLHNKNKKQVNVELLLKIKNDEIKELTKKIKNLELQNDKLKKANENTVKIPDNLPANVKTMIEALSIPKNRGRRYSAEEKHLFQILYYRDPGYYKFLRESLPSSMPSKISLLKWQPVKTLKPGVIPEIMLHLKSIAASLTDEQKKVALIFDEMDGRRGLHYDQGGDKIIGFEFLHKSTNNLAKKFLTVMIRFLNGQLGNIVIANFATATGISGVELATLIQYIVRILKEINLNVVATACDQSAVNRKAYSILGVTIETPYYLVNDHKVWALYDLPHLIKSVSCFELLIKIYVIFSSPLYYFNRLEQLS